MRRSCVRSAVHHLFAYGEGFAFGVSSWTDFITASISISACRCTGPSTAVVPSFCVIRALMSFHGAFLRRSLGFAVGRGTATSRLVTRA